MSTNKGQTLNLGRVGLGLGVGLPGGWVTPYPLTRPGLLVRQRWVILKLLL
jgi:hypothetical protein